MYISPLISGLTAGATTPTLLRNTTEVGCYAAAPNLTGRYSGVFNGDNITEDNVKEYPADIILKFLNLEGGWDFPEEEFQLLKELGKTMFIKLEPYNPNGNAETNKQFLDQIINGEFDNIIRQFANKAKAMGIPIFISFGHEMNGLKDNGKPMYPWGGNPEKFKLAWQHVYDVMVTEQGATNLVWVWNPHVIRHKENENKENFIAYYPGSQRVQIVAFDTYCENDNRSCGSLAEYTIDSVARMDNFYRLNPREASRPYAVGEWGAIELEQVRQMTHYIKSSNQFVFDIYFNEDAPTGNYILGGEREAAYRKYLSSFHGDQYNFSRPATNPDITGPVTYLLPSYPDPYEIITLGQALPPTINLTREQKLCPAGQTAFTPGCLTNFTPRWDPDHNLPARALTPDQLAPGDRILSPKLGFTHDFGTIVDLFSAQGVQSQIDKKELSLETLGSIFQALFIKSPTEFSDLKPFNKRFMVGSGFSLRHPQIAELKKTFPDFAEYLRPTTHFWQNIITLYAVYTQKLIESDRQAELREMAALGEYIIGRIDAQAEYEKQTRSAEIFVSPKYYQIVIRLLLAETYSQLRDAPLEKYQRGLKVAEEAIAKFGALAQETNSGPDYFSITKGVMVAADLHTKAAQFHMLKGEHAAARAEYDTAGYLYESLADLDFNQGRGLSLVPIGSSKIKLEFTPAEIIAALEKNEKAIYINHSEAIASLRNIFQFLHGIALLKQASLYMEYGFKPFHERSYDYILDKLILAYTGLKEIEVGSRFADLRYFRVFANLMVSKLLLAFADSLIISTFDLPEEQAKAVYRTALEKFNRDLSLVAPAEDLSTFFFNDAAPFMPEDFNFENLQADMENNKASSLFQVYDLDLPGFKKELRNAMVSSSSIPRSEWGKVKGLFIDPEADDLMFWPTTKQEEINRLNIPAPLKDILTEAFRNATTNKLLFGRQYPSGISLEKLVADFNKAIGYKYLAQVIAGQKASQDRADEPTRAKNKQLLATLYPQAFANKKHYDNINNFLLAEINGLANNIPAAFNKLINIPNLVDLINNNLDLALAQPGSADEETRIRNKQKLAEAYPRAFTNGRLLLPLFQPNSYDSTAVAAEMSWLKEQTLFEAESPSGSVSPVKKDSATPNYYALSQKLLRQTHVTSNFRLDFAAAINALSQRYLERADADFFAPNYYGKEDDLRQKNPPLYAEFLLQQVGLELRDPPHVSFKLNPKGKLDRTLGEKDKITFNEDRIKYLIGELARIDRLLPPNSYYHIEISLTRTSLTLTLEGIIKMNVAKKSSQRKDEKDRVRLNKYYQMCDWLFQGQPAANQPDPDFPLYRSFLELQAIKQKIDLQPEPNKTLLRFQYLTLTALIYISLAAYIEDYYGGADNIYLNLKKPEYTKAWRHYIKNILGPAQNMLRDLEGKLDDKIAGSAEPLTFNPHDFRVELYHELAIAYAIELNQPEMQHYLNLAKVENLGSTSKFNIQFRSWLLNNFAIPEPVNTSSSGKGGIKSKRRKPTGYSD